MKNVLKTKLVLIFIIILTAVAVNLSLRLDKINSIFFKNTESIASGENSGGVNYSKGYINDPKICTISETVRCDIPIYLPMYNTFCKIGFSYTVKHEGTQNYCLFTGGSSGCSYHECKRND